jgi:hypothetical protein
MNGTPEEIMRSALAFFLSSIEDPGIRQISYKALKEAYPGEDWGENLKDHDEIRQREFEERLTFAMAKFRE